MPLLARDDPMAALATLSHTPDVSGSVAAEAGRERAFLLAEVRDDPVFGRCAWVAHPGHAADDGELLRDLYAAAAEGWAKAGAERHYVLVPALNDALQPWYRLGFGHMHVEALRPIGIEHRSPPDGVRLRAGTRADLEVAEDLDLEIFNLQSRSPSFAGLSLDREARRREWLEINLNEEGLRYLVAEANGDLVGHTLIFRPEPVFGVPSNAASLVSTVVREGERGRGIGEAMLSEILRLAAEAGYGSVFTNWRMTNLSASRFWPALGFQPIYHRLHRKIGSG